MVLTSITNIPGIVSSLREAYTGGVTRPLEWRTKQLQALRKMVEENEDEIAEALHKDMSRPKNEAMIELLDVVSQVQYLQKNLGILAKIEKLPTPLTLKPMSYEVWKEPLGVVTIIAPFNFPFMLLLVPLAGAIAAGNACVLKPSELTAACAEIMPKLIAKYMDSSAIRVVTGGVPETTALLAQKVDCIMYTGGAVVARIVMAAAAKNLTPVILELGGMCPAYVDKSANIETSARRLLHAKCTNAGQMCIAPNHVFVHEKVRDEFLKALKTEHDRLYPGEDLLKNPDLGRIVNDRHYTRITGLLENHGGEVFMGGGTVDSKRFIPLTVVTNPSMDSNLMKEEIFGPIMPVITVKSVEEAAAIAREGNTPLASYVFDRDSKVRHKWLATVEAGGACVNDCLYHVLNKEMSGLSGKGESGMGRVRGKDSFNAFTHSKVVGIQAANFDPLARYPPYKESMALIRMILVGEIPSWVKAAFWGAAAAVGLAVVMFVKKHVSVSVSFH